MKNFFYNLCILLLLFAVTAGTVQAQTGYWADHTETFDDSNGRGAEDNPIEINTAGQLAMLAKKVNGGDLYAGKFFVLTADLDLGSHLWTSIGIRANEDLPQVMMPFSGVFNGNGHVISNLYVSNNHYDNGLFSTISADATVKNLSMVNCFVGGRNGIGAVVASNYGTVTNCNASGKVNGLTHHAGILVGFNNPGGVISNCYSSGTVSGAGNNVGGLVGFNDKGATITNSYTIGSATGNIFVGGLVGINNGDIINCYASGIVNGNNYVGGLVGINGYVDEEDLGSTEGDAAAIINSYAVGNVTVNGAAGIAGGFIGVDKSPVPVVSSYFDPQGTGQKLAIGLDADLNQKGNVLSLTTAVFTNGNLPESFAAGVWQVSMGYYPQLKVFDGNDNNKAWSALSAVPLMLDNTKERSDSVRTTFQLAAQTSLGEDIGWTVSPAATAFIGNRWVSSINVASWDTLTLAVDGRSRMIVYRPADKFSDAHILAYEMGGKRYENPEQLTQIPVDCSYAASQIEVTVITNPWAKVTPGKIFSANVSQVGSYTHDVTVTSVDDKFTNQYTLSVDRLLAADIFLQRWNDVLAVINNRDNNGGYTFTAYEWYKNGNKLETTGGYIQEPGDLDKTAEYTALLTTSAGERFGTCPAVISDVQVKLIAYPNPVQRGQIVRIETNIPPEAGKAVIKLFDQLGNTVKSMVMRDMVTEMAMPSVSGQYLMQVVTGTSGQTFKIIVE